VRLEAEKLVVETSAWTNSTAIFNFTALKDIQQTNIQKACDKEMAKNIKRTPTRWTPKTIHTKGTDVSSTCKATATSNTTSNPTSTASNPGETKSTTSVVLDTNDELWEQLPAISFNSALSKIHFYKLLTESKWALRKQAWDDAIKICGGGSSNLFRLEKENFSDMYRTMKTTLNNDSNMKVRISALQLIGKMALGGRKNFTKYAISLFSVLLSLYKEKHKLHKMAVDHCIDQLFVYCIQDVNDVFHTCMSVVAAKGAEQTGSLHDSNPLVRTCTLEVLERYIARLPASGVGNKFTSSHKQVMDQIVQIASTMCSDKVPGVRDAACSLLSALFTSLGPAHSSVSSTIKLLEKKNPQLLKKILNAGGNGGGVATKQEKKKNARLSTGSTKPSSSSSTTAAPSATTASASVAAPARTVNKSSKRSNDTEDNSDLMSLEAAKVVIGDLQLSADTTCRPGTDDAPPKTTPLVELLLDATQWQDKETAINTMSTWISENGNAVTTSMLEGWLVVMSKGTRQFQERNRNVMKATVCNVQHLATACGTAIAFPTRGLNLFVQPLVSKFSEKVLVKDLTEMYLLVAECVGPQSVASRMAVAMEKTTSPAVLQNAFQFLTRLVNEFSFHNRSVASMFHVNKLLDLAKSKKVGLGHRLPKVKDNAELFVLELCKCSSDPGGMNSIVPLLEDIVPKRLASMKQKIEKIAASAAAAASTKPSSGGEGGRSVKPVAGTAGTEGGDQEKTAPPKVAGVDLTSKLPTSMLKQMETMEGKSAWKQRSGAIEDAAKVVSAVYGTGQVVVFNRAIHDLIQALKKRMSDANVKVAEKSITLIGIIATKVGEPIARCSKIIIQPLLKLLSGNKKKGVMKVREVLDQWVTQGGETTCTSIIDSCVPFMADALGQFVNGKKSAAAGEMLAFMVKHVASSSSVVREHMETMVPHVLFCLGDKSKLTRDNAEHVLNILATRVDEDVVRTALGNIKGQHGKNIAPTVNQILANTTSTVKPMPKTSKTSKTSKMSKMSKTTKQKMKKATIVDEEEADMLPTNNHKKKTNKGKIQGDANKVNRNNDDGEPLFVLTDNRDKLKRAKFDSHNKWVRSDDPKAPTDKDVVRQLEDQLHSVVSTSLYTRMFPTSKNDATCARSLCSACQTIVDVIQEDADNVVLDGLVSSLDLVFKWMTLHIDTNKGKNLC
jgi:hypothetical protein